MPSSRASTLVGRDDTRFTMEPRTFAGFLVAIAAVIVIAVLSYDSLRVTERSAESLTRAVEILAQTQSLISTLKDAETGQRGFLLTGRESYLEPFLAARESLPAELARMRALLSDEAAQLGRLESLQSLAGDKIQELNETVELKRAGKADAALAVVLTDRGMSRNSCRWCAYGCRNRRRLRGGRAQIRPRI